MPRLFVVFVPGLNLRILQRIEGLERLSATSCCLAIVPAEPVNAASFEATCLSGLLPAHHGIRGGKKLGIPPRELAFWTRAQARREFATEVCGFSRAGRSEAQLVISRWKGKWEALLEDSRQLATHGNLCLIGTPQNARCLSDAVERPVLIGCGFARDKLLIGACEVAGMLDAVITDVEVRDKA